MKEPLEAAPRGCLFRRLEPGRDQRLTGVKYWLCWSAERLFL